ncbi:MAG: helix-turn-helix transcriptional regulator [Clostridiales Family XIII bacterium]|nr:helix-turn-helix domain-containing protein [Clostridia bacterium]MDY3010035.1 helix-turn-helix transcriptional regulator [Clostridiales Family XIII bacterium]
MNTESERLKQLRKVLNIKQGDFAEKISTTQGHISDIENGRKNLSDRTIKLICLEKWNGNSVNEEWLRTGTGEMFQPLPEEDETAAFVSDLLEDGDNELYVMIKEIMRTYDQLDEKSKAVIKQFSRSLLENIKKQGG